MKTGIINTYSPSMKALVMTKIRPLYNPDAHFIDRENIEVLNGVEYMPDNEVRPELQAALFNNKKLTELAEETDVFVNVKEGKNVYGYYSLAQMWYLNKENTVKHVDILELSDKSQKTTQKALDKYINEMKEIKTNKKN